MYIAFIQHTQHDIDGGDGGDNQDHLRVHSVLKYLGGTGKAATNRGGDAELGHGSVDGLCRF